MNTQGTQRDISGQVFTLTSFLSTNAWLIQSFQLPEGGRATSCLTSVLICAGMLTNSGFEANAVRFSTASIKGAVAVLHLLRFSSEKSPSRAWKVHHDWLLSESVYWQNWRKVFESFIVLNCLVFKTFGSSSTNEADAKTVVLYACVSFLSWIWTLNLKLLLCFKTE